MKNRRYFEIIFQFVDFSLKILDEECKCSMLQLYLNRNLAFKTLKFYIFFISGYKLRNEALNSSMA